MSYTLILIGGSGQRFGLALGLLNLLGRCTLPRRIVVLDAEGTGAGGVNAVTQNMDRLLRWGQEHVPLDRIPPYPPAPGGDLSSLTMERCIGTENSEVFGISMDAREEALSVERGFFANPK